MLPNILIIIALLLMIPSLILIPMMLPGLPYLFVIAIIYGAIDRFAHVSGPEFFILGGIVVLGIIIDQLAGVLGARWGGARGKTFLFGIAGAILGTFLLPIPVFGGFVGLFIGVLIGELIRRRKINADHAKGGAANGRASDTTPVASSLKAATASILGSATGMLFNLLLAVLFIGLFVGFVFGLL